MADEKRRGLKSETLTIRLDPRTRFIVEFISRVRGQTITTVVERALAEAADRLTVDGPLVSNATWQYYWDTCEGIRELKIAANPALFPTAEEERRLEFVRTHWPFFCTSPRCNEYLRHYIHILWPRINEYMERWESERTRDYYAAGAAMQKALEEARLESPEWPPDLEDDSDIEDDIPF